MRRYFFLIVIAVFVSGVSHAAYPENVEKDIVDRAMQGQMMIFARDYENATAVFEKLEKEFPDHPIGYFGQMAVLEMRMVEKEDFSLSAEFLKIAEKGNASIISTLNRKPSDFDLLVCGSLEGMKGFHHARKYQWWDAYAGGVKSRQTFARIKKRNPEFYDADFGLGMYIYWRSVYTQDLKFLPFFPDRREEGMAILEEVSEKGSFAKDLAKVNLGLMYLEEKRFDKAHEVFGSYVKRFPNNVLIAMFDARSLLAAKRYDEAVSVLRHLLKVDRSQFKAHYFIGLARVLQKNPAHYAEAEKELKYFDTVASKGEWKAAANYWMGRLEEERGNKESAVKYYEIALQQNPNIKNLELRIRGLGSGL